MSDTTIMSCIVITTRVMIIMAAIVLSQSYQHSLNISLQFRKSSSVLPQFSSCICSRQQLQQSLNTPPTGIAQVSNTLIIADQCYLAIVIVSRTYSPEKQFEINRSHRHSCIRVLKDDFTPGGWREDLWYKRAAGEEYVIGKLGVVRRDWWAPKWGGLALLHGVEGCSRGIP
jgi:hypothetical protein